MGNLSGEVAASKKYFAKKATSGFSPLHTLRLSSLSSLRGQTWNDTLLRSFSRDARQKRREFIFWKGFLGVRETQSALATQKKLLKTTLHIAHCHKACNYFIQEDPLLSGTIEDLKILEPNAAEELDGESESEVFSDNDTYFNGHEESDDEDSDIEE